MGRIIKSEKIYFFKMPSRRRTDLFLDLIDFLEFKEWQRMRDRRDGGCCGRQKTRHNADENKMKGRRGVVHFASKKSKKAQRKKKLLLKNICVQFDYQIYYEESKNHLINIQNCSAAKSVILILNAF